MNDIQWYVQLELPQKFQSISSDPYADEKERIELYPYRILNRYLTTITKLFGNTYSYSESEWNSLLNTKAKPPGQWNENEEELYHFIHSPHPVRPGSVSYQHVIVPYTPEELDEVFCEKFLTFHFKDELVDFLNYHFENFDGEPEDFLSHIEELLNKKLDTIQSDTFRKVTPLIRRRIKVKVLSWINSLRSELLLPLNQTPQKDSSRTQPATQVRISRSNEKNTIVKRRYLELTNGTATDKEKPLTHIQAMNQMIKDFDGSNPSYHKVGNKVESRKRSLNRTLKSIQRKK